MPRRSQNRTTQERRARLPTFAPTKGTSSTHADAQQGSLLLQIVSDGTSKLPALSIPIKFAQALISGYSIFCPRASTPERIIHSFQATFATIELILASIAVLQEETCDEELVSNLCLWLLIITNLYRGILLVSSAANEVNKRKHNQDRDDSDEPENDDEDEAAAEEIAPGATISSMV